MKKKNTFEGFKALLAWKGIYYGKDFGELL